MARVSWGHTGRDIEKPPKLIGLLFILVILSAVIRVFFPIIYENFYIQWIGISQVLWIMAFSLFFLIYCKVLISPRIDGNIG